MSSIVASNDNISRQTTFSKQSDTFIDLEEDKPATADEKTGAISNNANDKYNIKNYKGSKNMIESLRLLEPARKKLSSLETQRIMGVVDMAIKQTEIITALPTVLKNIDSMSTVLTRNLVLLLENYKSIKLELDKQIAKLDAIKGIRQNRLKELEEHSREETLASEDFWAKPSSTVGATKSYSEEYGVVEYTFTDVEIEKFGGEQESLELQFEELCKQLKISIMSLIIGLKSNPQATAALTSSDKDWKIKRGPNEIYCVRKLKQLKDIMTMKLTTTPLERDENHSFLRKVHEKDKANRVVVHELEQELSVAIDKRDKLVQEKNDTIRKLQMDIHHVTKVAEDNKKKLKMDMERQIENDEKNSESVCQKLKQEISQKKSEYNAKLNEGRGNEKELRAEKFKLDSTLEAILQKYDESMTEDQAIFEATEEEHNEEKKQLQEMEERFKALEEEYLAIMEERRIAEEKREAARQEEEILTKAVVTIQSFWRSYKIRKGVRGKKKGKGKGKKKK